MTSRNVFDMASTRLREGFTPNPADQKDGRITPYGAIKDAFGMKPADPAFAYNGSDWRALNAAVREAFTTLDSVLRARGTTPSRFSVWSTQPTRTLDEVLRVFEEASAENPDLVVTEQAVLRPAPAGLPGRMKPRWVVCAQLALISEARGESIPEVLRSIDIPTSMTPLETIDLLDAVIEHEEIGPLSRLKGPEAKALSSAWGAAMRTDLMYPLGKLLLAFDLHDKDPAMHDSHFVQEMDELQQRFAAAATEGEPLSFD